MLPSLDAFSTPINPVTSTENDARITNKGLAPIVITTHDINSNRNSNIIETNISKMADVHKKYPLLTLHRT